MESYVEFLGARPQSELPELYANCDAFVLPSVREGMGLVLAEALLCGAPVIATASGGVTDIVRDGETGLLFPERDANALADALERYARDAQYAARLAANGRAFVLPHFSPEHAANNFLKVMKSPQVNNSSSVEPVLSKAKAPSSDLTIALFLALLLFGVYLLSFNGRITSSDGLSMFAVTESFVKRGEFSTDQMWTFFGTKSVAAPDGEVYSKYGYGTSLFAAPLYALALYFPFSGLMQVTLLASALAVALTGALVFLAARRLNFSALVSTFSALLFGLATPAWVYAKEFWSEPFAAMTFFAAFYFLLCYRAELKQRDVLFAGILLGLAIAVRTTNVLLVPLYVWYAFDFQKQQNCRGDGGWACFSRRLPCFSFLSCSTTICVFKILSRPVIAPTKISATISCWAFTGCCSVRAKDCLFMRRFWSRCPLASGNFIKRKNAN